MWLRPKILVTLSLVLCPGGGGGGILPMMAYTGRLRPAGVSFSGLRYTKGLRFH